ncbi:MAG: thermonuclease family protein, partial [Acidobacteriota bacterium]
MRIIIATILTFSLMVVAVQAQRRRGKARAAAKEATTTPVVSTPIITAPNAATIVTRVISGDLLELQSGELVRLMGADAPVMPAPAKPGQEPWASEARHFIEGLVLDKEIKIDGLGLTTDEYGRRIGLVYIDNTWVDYELVRLGLAMVQQNPYLKNSFKQQLLDAQREARASYRGIWNSSKPLEQSPRDFRAANGLPEGDDTIADAWKRTATPKAPASKEELINSAASTPELQSASQVIEAIVEIQTRLGKGVKSAELGRLVATANEQFTSFKNSSPPPDRILVRDFNDALDAYRLALDALKRKETAATADSPQ